MPEYSKADLEFRGKTFKVNKVEHKVNIQFKNFADMKEAAVAMAVWKCQQRMRDANDKGDSHGMDPKQCPTIGSDGRVVVSHEDLLLALDYAQMEAAIALMKAKMAVMKPEPTDNFSGLLDRRDYTETELEDMSFENLLALIGFYSPEEDYSNETSAQIISDILVLQSESNDSADSSEPSE